MLRKLMKSENKKWLFKINYAMPELRPDFSEEENAAKFICRRNESTPLIATFIVLKMPDRL